jgi:glucose-1-phosphate adenylyltransferase
VFGADHIYTMDMRQMVRFHLDAAAAATVAALPIPLEDAVEFGTLEVDRDWRITGFYEKTANPPEIPGRPGWALASMGNYLFQTEVLRDVLLENASQEGTRKDFGHDILPKLVKVQRVFAYDFNTNIVPGESELNTGYWRDVGTVDAYFEANMDVRSVEPRLNLYNREWPVRTAAYNEGPVKCTFNQDGRRGVLIDSTACSGTILAGGEVVDSVLARRVFVDSGAQVNESILLENCHIGAGAAIRRAIVDRNAVIAPGAEIGFDLEKDRKRYHVTENGVVVVVGPPTVIPLAMVAI